MANWNEWNRTVIEEFRENDGRVGGDFDGAPLLLLSTTGAKTGQRRTCPLMYLRDNDRLVVFASQSRSPHQSERLSFHFSLATARIVAGLWTGWPRASMPWSCD